MSRISSASHTREPEDIIAIFHCSFHPTRGNIIDWSIKASEDLNLDGVEFSTLPSGLHLVDEDVVHITQNVHHGISVFRKRSTAEAGMRGFRLESLGILVAQSSRPRPWRHLGSLKELSRQLGEHWESSKSQYAEDQRDWSLVEEWYKRRVFRRIGEEGRWVDWEEELTSDNKHHPALHLPHLLRILGPSSLTLYKHVLARRRVLIYTNPAVEPACILARIASDICGEEDRPTVLGMVGINDMDKLTEESFKGHGWIACTTDAIFLEKPSFYDLVIDMTASRPSRPAFFVSRPAPPSLRGPRHRLVPVRFTFSDVRLWSELDKALRADAEEGTFEESKTRWTDGWRLYEDVCVACAGAWMDGWKSGSTSWGIGKDGTLRVTTKGRIQLDGEDEGIRNLGKGIEGRPLTQWKRQSSVSTTNTHLLSREVRTTLALLSIFHAHSEFLSERLSELLEDATADGNSSTTVVLTPKDIMSLELGIWSELDAKFLEWLAERNKKSAGKKVIVRRGWRDLLGALLGFG
ncbi:hypothetical protein M422DRAFT_780791 [Sphaerobolus stellatus SS14]|uniref:Protein LCHN n=1 Tax=Sphaerobolus stellatus (strain SS14) TaxID=990650 RepID=A0A0C9UB18_SPHS4|nr:hypothetical protein M422DRAFT_780791 [Sphaerobolus stellatus SS14]